MENLLLRRLGATDLALIHPWLVTTSHSKRAFVARSGEPIERVYFPDRTVLAVSGPGLDAHRHAVGLVGYEGFVGWPALLGSRSWPHDVILRCGSGRTISIEVPRLADACRSSRTLQDLLLCFANTFMIQMGRTMAAGVSQSIERRLSRWLLLIHDRIEDDQIALTHNEIAAMLGTRRASVTDALHVLEGERAIRNVRGRITVRDRARLEAIAQHSYGYATAEYRKLIGNFGKATTERSNSDPITIEVPEPEQKLPVLNMIPQLNG